ncbi:hypothetical protein K503DRAFT_806528 [Rhizopogon vinicolor AM-OR11-026]|uniref:Uncharacterized protein n=1 Tax=Rhizopogon vinicolor AM-OR11-026 TaxID=1314800 RepID=A0A1B7MED3_9AGAM|nr:hypothetical protein K503DRAFT_806528 [Rhizopogon vinicolor AM-OR11-026]
MTSDNLIQFSPARPTRQTFLLVCPWDRSLLELSHFAESPELSDMENVESDWSSPTSPLHWNWESYSQAFFGEFLLVQHQGHAFSDHSA